MANIAIFQTVIVLFVLAAVENAKSGINVKVDTQLSVPDSLALFPRQNKVRQVQSLDGVWIFKTIKSDQNQDIGIQQKWFTQSLMNIDSDYERMPVPSSFNDITEKREIRDYVGNVWYDRKFYVPHLWKDAGQVLIRFGSVNYEATVYVNGFNVVKHTGGHIPFNADLTKVVRFGEENHISVMINNVLTSSTLPQGSVKYKNDTRKANTKFSEYRTSFDFFNYAGIHRSVLLFLVPSVRITNLIITTDQQDSTGTIIYTVELNIPEGADLSKYSIDINVYDRSGKLVTTVHEQVKKNVLNGKILIKDVHLWWPFTMSQTPGYLYTLDTELSHHEQGLVDSYQQKIGIRTIKLEGTQLLVNGKPFYFRGFGKHEDADVRGRSMDQSLILKDFNLIKWIGANSFRTSHYPYSEEIMDEADEQGIVVIDECPAVALQSFEEVLLNQHLKTITDLIDRDKNRPSVFMWSIANEPRSDKIEAAHYFRNVSLHAREIDPGHRPITGAINMDPSTEHMSPSLDVIMINRYYAWYSDCGYPQVIQGYMLRDMQHFFDKTKKPLMISEYGADTIAGFHAEPGFVFSEDYQAEYLIEHHKAFDILIKKGFLMGEMIWNFADFMTIQDTTRVGGNKKGIFTRNRQPKASARLLRCRYWHLTTNEENNPNRRGFSYCPDMHY